MNVAETVTRHATLRQKFTVSLSCLILTPVRALQKRLGSNDMGGGLCWGQLKKALVFQSVCHLTDPG
jgi:hypothetical protein